MKYLLTLLFCFLLASCGNNDESISDSVPNRYYLNKNVTTKNGVVFKTVKYDNEGNCMGKSYFEINDLSVKSISFNENGTGQCFESPINYYSLNSTNKTVNLSDGNTYNYNYDGEFFKLSFNYQNGDGNDYQEVIYYKK